MAHATLKFNGEYIFRKIIYTYFGDLEKFALACCQMCTLQLRTIIFELYVEKIFLRVKKVTCRLNVYSLEIITLELLKILIISINMPAQLGNEKCVVS